MAYGGVLSSISLWFPAPTPRLDKVGEPPAPYVREPLIVMFPLGPEMVELYLWILMLK